jgi:LysM repeat protein
MKKVLIIIVFVLFPGFELLSNEPFVILEYQGNNFENSNQKKINRNNKFLKNQNYSVIHKVKDGESLSGILNKYYGNTGLNMKIVEISIIEINKHAFVRDNPHFLYAGKKIKIPSVNEIMNLVKSKPNRMSGSKVNNKSHIYFFGN